jgi:flavin-binding protein dodecin
MKRRVVSDAALKAAGARATKASAKLAGHEVPDGHVRSEAVSRYLARLEKVRLEQADPHEEDRDDDRM